MIELRGVTLKLDNVKLENLNLRIHDGEYLVIMGPSGAGKTLLLMLIAGILKPDEGRIYIDGKDVTSLPPEERGVVIVPQSYALFPHMTVYENIAYGLRVRGLDDDIVKQRVLRTARALGIYHLLHRRPGTLSEGEKQRVAIARALVLEPKILLLDEPTSALDLKSKSRVLKLLAGYHERRKPTIVHVTHDPLEATQVGDRVIYMEDGRIKKIIEHPSLENLLSELLSN